MLVEHVYICSEEKVSIGDYMDKKETVLIKVTYLVELTEDEVISNDCILDEITHKIGNDEKLIAKDKTINLKWNGTSSFVLDPNNKNCGRCVNCGAWVTDREKPDAIPELCNGATVNGKLLCDECLPSEHRWAF